MNRPEEPEIEPEVEQPGLSRLREAVANYAGGWLPRRAALLRDGLAGLNCAVTSVPDGLACGILAGVNPIFGLYAAMMGPIAGGIFSSSPLLLISTTSASALAAGQALAGLSGEARSNALFLMVILVGLIQLVLGVLRLGRLTRFVSYSVMTGFLAGIAVLTILSQLPTITGYEAQGGNNIAKTIDLLSNLDQISLLALALAVITFPLMILLPRTRLGSLGVLAAIAIPSLLTAALRWASVQTVRDIGDIPGGIPGLHWPSFSGITPGVVSGALSVAIIILVQGAGVSQSIPNPGGVQWRVSRDFIGHGAANLASGLFRGLPVGGSLSTTAVNVTSGARTRWSVISAGLWMVVIVAAFPNLVSLVAMPALGVVLIIASLNAINPREERSIWDTGWPSRLAIVVTFIATLFLPISLAMCRWWNWCGVLMGVSRNASVHSSCGRTGSQSWTSTAISSTPGLARWSGCCPLPAVRNDRQWSSACGAKCVPAPLWWKCWRATRTGCKM